MEKMTNWKLELLIHWLKYYGLVFDWKPYKQEMEIKDQSPAFYLSTTKQ